jgi:Gluconate 2-dehydrogenase subunit 3
MKSIQRRDFVKGMMAAAMSAKTMLGQQAAPQATPPVETAPTPVSPPVPPAPGPVPWMRGLGELKPLPMTALVPDAVADTKITFFSAQQMATLRRLSELLLPPLNGFPGAIDAGAPEFLDFLIGASPLDRQQMYRFGLDRLDAEAKKHAGTSFAAVSTAQADPLLRPWLRTWMPDHPPADPYAHFINIAHSDIRTATLNSQAWSVAAHATGQPSGDSGLYWFPVDPDMHREGAAQICGPIHDRKHS